MSGRNWLAGFAAVAIWLICFYCQHRPAVLGPNAPATQFSAARADGILARLLGPEQPHPAGSAEDAAMHARVLADFTRLGVKTDTLSAMSCYGEARWRAVTCAHVTDIIGEVAPGEGPAIILMAHMDSVAAGPGAGDDGSGVATILEAIRAFQVRGLSTKHPVLALITDGEENAMLGASAFLADPSWRARVGVVINLEARGNKGRDLSVPDQPRRRRFGGTLCPRRRSSGGQFALCRNLQKTAQRHRPYAFLERGIYRLQFFFHRRRGAISHAAGSPGQSGPPIDPGTWRLRPGPFDRAGAFGFRRAQERRRDLFRRAGFLAATACRKLGRAAFAAGVAGHPVRGRAPSSASAPRLRYWRLFGAAASSCGRGGCRIFVAWRCRIGIRPPRSFFRPSLGAAPGAGIRRRKRGPDLGAAERRRGRRLVLDLRIGRGGRVHGSGLQPLFHLSGADRSFPSVGDRPCGRRRAAVRGLDCGIGRRARLA